MSCNTCGNPMTSHFHTKGYCSEVCLRDGHIEALESELEQSVRDSIKRITELSDENHGLLCEKEKIEAELEQRSKVVEVLAKQLVTDSFYRDECPRCEKDPQGNYSQHIGCWKQWAEAQVKEGKQ